eukprot:1134846-Lingulodinium_polyedra.AAC.1
MGPTRGGDTAPGCDVPESGGARYAPVSPAPPPRGGGPPSQTRRENLQLSQEDGAELALAVAQ